MTTDISTLVDYSEYDLGLEQSDFRPPRIQFSGKEGTFAWDEAPEDAMESFAAVVLRMLPKTRVYWPDQSSNEVACRSNDNLSPVDPEQARGIGAGGPMHRSCAACPFSQFSKNEKGETVRPACTMFVNLALATFDDGEAEQPPTPFLFRTHGTGIEPALKMLSSLQITAKRERRAPFSVVVEFTAGDKVKKPPRIEYYPLRARVTPERLPGDALPVYADLYRAMSTTSFDLTADAPTSAEPDFDANGEPVTAEAQTAVREEVPTQPAFEASDEEMVTEAQLRTINVVGKQIQLSNATVDAECIAQFGNPPTGLTKREASQFIDVLKARGEKQPAAAR